MATIIRKEERDFQPHRFAEELFLMLTGSAMLLTPEGLTAAHPGDTT